MNFDTHDQKKNNSGRLVHNCLWNSRFPYPTSQPAWQYQERLCENGGLLLKQTTALRPHFTTYKLYKHDFFISKQSLFYSWLTLTLKIRVSFSFKVATATLPLGSHHTIPTRYNATIQIPPTPLYNSITQEVTCKLMQKM